MKTRNKILLLLSGITLSLGVAGTVSYALYERQMDIRNSSNTLIQITSKGQRFIKVYCNLGGVWNTHDENDDYNIWMCAWKDGYGDCFWEVAAVSDRVVDTDTYKVFDFDTTKYNRLSFHRVSTTYTGGDAPSSLNDRYRVDSGGKSTNLTGDLEKPSDKNAYKITSWTTSGAYGFLSGGSWVANLAAV